jgi:NAD(P)H-hydrate repair Nnr-like enzyme with NAD(P)H-hydrate epimerase domain
MPRHGLNGREIVTNAQMRAIDARAAELGAPTNVLMENAGSAVAEQIIARYPMQTVAVLCGPGDNGGDGFVVARKLKRNGWPVWVETLAGALKLKGAAAEMAARWGGETRPLSADNPTADLYVAWRACLRRRRAGWWPWTCRAASTAMRRSPWEIPVSAPR